MAWSQKDVIEVPSIGGRKKRALSRQILGDILEQMFAFHRYSLYASPADDRHFQEQHRAIWYCPFHRDFMWMWNLCNVSSAAVIGVGGGGRRVLQPPEI